MLICTNDGFIGLNGAQLPNSYTGPSVFFLHAYDAGWENNTEDSPDIVDPCSALGAVVLPGDPDGDRNATVMTMPCRPDCPSSRYYRGQRVDHGAARLVRSYRPCDGHPPLDPAADALAEGAKRGGAGALNGDPGPAAWLGPAAAH
jgi:hypothetical protein